LENQKMNSDIQIKVENIQSITRDEFHRHAGLTPEAYV